MDSASFDALLESTKEAKEILAKKRNPSRTFYVEEPDPNAQHLCSHTQKLGAGQKETGRAGSCVAECSEFLS